MGVKHRLYAYNECIRILFNLATSYFVSLYNRLYYGSEVVNCELKKINLKSGANLVDFARVFHYNTMLTVMLSS